MALLGIAFSASIAALSSMALFVARTVEPTNVS